MRLGEEMEQCVGKKELSQSFKVSLGRSNIKDIKQINRRKIILSTQESHILKKFNGNR